MENGKLIIISAPSGSGKTTIIKRLLKQDFKLGFSVSATSRAKRKSEKDGTDYYFITAADFRKKIYNDEFLEWEEVYENIYYGTLKSEVERITGSGNNIIFDVDVVGASNIKKLYGERAFSLFIMPPSVEELRRRLVSRSSDTEDAIEMRIRKARKEIDFFMANRALYDKVIINDILNIATEETIAAIQSFLMK